MSEPIATGLAAPNYTQLPNAILDALPTLTDAELRVALAICRQTFGWHKDRDRLSLSQLERLTGRGRPAVTAGIQGLLARGWLERRPTPARGGQSYTYRLAVERISLEDDTSVLVHQRTSTDHATAETPDRDPPHPHAQTGEVVRQRTSTPGGTLAYPQKKTKERDEEIPPPPNGAYRRNTPQGGGGVAYAPESGLPNRAAASPPEGARLLAAEGFGSQACLEFGHLPAAVLQAEIARRRQLGQGPGAMVKAWRLAPPGGGPATAAAPRRVSDALILTAPQIGAEERMTWLARFRNAAEGDRPAVLERFRRECLAGVPCAD